MSEQLNVDTLIDANNTLELHMHLLKTLATDQQNSLQKCLKTLESLETLIGNQGVDEMWVKEHQWLKCQLSVLQQEYNSQAIRLASFNKEY